MVLQYPINSIASVNAATITYADEHSGSWLNLAGGVVVGIIAISMGSIIGIIIGLVAFGYAYMMKPRVETFENNYSVEISTSAGSQQTFTTSEKEKVLSIVNAINEAIINRG